MRGFAGAILILCSLSSAAVWSQPWVQTGRYSAIETVPTPAQRSPLNAIISVEFPEEVTTVGHAIQSVVAGTGYRLSDVLYWDADVLELWQQSLPHAHRTLGPLSVRTALMTLIGPAFHLIVDPVHRLLGFELNPDIRPLGFDPNDESQEGS